MYNMYFDGTNGKYCIYIFKNVFRDGLSLEIDQVVNCKERDVV